MLYPLNVIMSDYKSNKTLQALTVWSLNTGAEAEGSSAQ